MGEYQNLSVIALSAIPCLAKPAVSKDIVQFTVLAHWLQTSEYQL